MIKRLLRADPAFQEVLDGRRGVWEEETAIELEVGILCDLAADLWPSVFMALVNSSEHTEPCWAIGLADNHNHKKKLIPTLDQLRQLRTKLDLRNDEIPLRWYREPYPSQRF